MSGGFVLDWPEALRRKSANRKARWDTIAGELEGEVWPEINPSFRIRSGDTVFTIGSCFARNIEANLAALGCKVPMLSLDFPTQELNGQPRSAMNRFHPPAFRQCLEWTARIHDRDGVVSWADCAPMAIAGTSQATPTFFDLDMAGSIAVTRERFIERRQHIYDIFSTVFSAACMMMTPGVAEAFKDRETGLYLYGAPNTKTMLSQPERWEYEILSFERCLEDMLAAIDVVRERNPDIKILVTTSPVPLGLTFSGRDVRVANAYSKSVLRAVCDVAAMRRPMVDYFPSYETVTLSEPSLAWNHDRLHVSQALIAKIVARMTDSYLEGVSPVAQSHQAAMAAISEGDLDSAAASAHAALELQPDHFGARLALLEVLVGRSDWAEAERLAQALIEQDPMRPEPMFRLARVLAAQGRAEEAMAWLARALELPGVSQPEAQSICKLIARSPPEAALPVARRLVERFPKQVEVYPPLLELLLASDQKAEALEVVQRAVRLPKAPKAFRHRLAQLLLWRGDLAEAERVLSALLAKDPDDAFSLKLKQVLDRRLERAAARAGAA